MNSKDSSSALVTAIQLGANLALPWHTKITYTQISLVRNRKPRTYTTIVTGTYIRYERGGKLSNIIILSTSVVIAVQNILKIDLPPQADVEIILNSNRAVDEEQGRITLLVPGFKEVST